jgi:hypothetical protein
MKACLIPRHPGHAEVALQIASWIGAARALDEMERATAISGRKEESIIAVRNGDYLFRSDVNCRNSSSHTK